MGKTKETVRRLADCAMCGFVGILFTQPSRSTVTLMHVSNRVYKLANLQNTQPIPYKNIPQATVFFSRYSPFKNKLTVFCLFCSFCLKKSPLSVQFLMYLKFISPSTFFLFTVPRVGTMIGS